MTLMLNAWLERAAPRLQLMNFESGGVVLELPAGIVKEMLESGDVSLDDSGLSIQELLDYVQMKINREEVNGDYRRLKRQLGYVNTLLCSQSWAANVSLFPWREPRKINHDL